jgi:hypothetical protein
MSRIEHENDLVVDMAALRPAVFQEFQLLQVSGPIRAIP